MIVAVSLDFLHLGWHTFTLCGVEHLLHLAGLRIKLTLSHEGAGAVALLDALHALMKILAHLLQSGVGLVHLELHVLLLHGRRLPTCGLCRRCCALDAPLLCGVILNRLNRRRNGLLLRLSLCRRLCRGCGRWRGNRADVL